STTRRRRAHVRGVHGEQRSCVRLEIIVRIDAQRIMGGVHVPPEVLQIAAACVAAFLAGAINSVAGGGTLISFPTLLWLGLPSIIANATSTVAIWPGSLGSLWGFRREFGRTDAVM